MHHLLHKHNLELLQSDPKIRYPNKGPENEDPKQKQSVVWEV